MEEEYQTAFAPDVPGGIVPLPPKQGYYVRWMLPEMGDEGAPCYFRTSIPSKDLEAAKRSIVSIRKTFGKINAWDFAVVYWNGLDFDVIYIDPESVYSEDEYLMEYQAETYN